MKSSLCDYSDTFILITEYITINKGNDTYVAFKIFSSFCTCKTN